MIPQPPLSDSTTLLLAPVAAPEDPPGPVQIDADPSKNRATHERKHEARHRPTLATRAEIGLSSHLGGPSPAAAAHVDIRWSHLHLGLGGRSWRPRRLSIPAFPENGARLRLWATSSYACAVGARGPLEFPICLGASVGLLRSASFGQKLQPNDHRTLWMTADSEARVALRLGERTSLHLGIGLQLPLTSRSPRIIVHHGNRSLRLYKTPPLTVHTNLGLQVHFP